MERVRGPSLGVLLVTVAISVAATAMAAVNVLVEAICGVIMSVGGGIDVYGVNNMGELNETCGGDEFLGFGHGHLYRIKQVFVHAHIDVLANQKLWHTLAYTHGG